jgi:hypothetical protein
MRINQHQLFIVILNLRKFLLFHHFLHLRPSISPFNPVAFIEQVNHTKRLLFIYYFLVSFLLLLNLFPEEPHAHIHITISKKESLFLLIALVVLMPVWHFIFMLLTSMMTEIYCEMIRGP